MANGAFKFKDNSGNVVASLSNSGSNIVISGGTLDLSGMTGLTLGNVTMSGTTQNASTASFAPNYLLSSSFNSYTGITNAQLRLSSLEIVTGSIATTGSNIFIGTQTITGSLYISANLVVQGSSSLEDITGSNVYIGTNKINLNTDTPAIRFGGISVFDSGSNFGESGSLLWDSQNNRWIYQHPSSSGAPYKSAMLISGPQNSGSLGSEATLTSGKIQKAVGDDHIGDSIITETNNIISIAGNTFITGSITNRGVVIDGANNSNVTTLNLTRTDNSWAINNETNLRVYVGSGNTTSPGTKVLELTTAGNMSLTGSLSTTGTITSSVNGSTFGTASTSGRAIVIQAGSGNQAIQLKNAAGGDGTIYATGTSTTMNYEFNTYSVGGALVISNGGTVTINGGSTSNDSGEKYLKINGSGTPASSIYLNQIWNGVEYPSIIQATKGSTYGNASSDMIIKTSYWNGSSVVTSERLRVTELGNIGVNVTPTSGNRFWIKGEDASSSNSTLYAQNGSGTPLLFVRNDGNIGVATTSPNSKLHVNGDVRSDGSFLSYISPGGSTVDSSSSFTTLANGAYVDFPSMSGIIIVNNTGTGAVQVFICGGGNTTSIGYVVNNTGSMTHSPGVGGYRFTNNTGSSWTFAFMALKTRQTA